MCELGISDTCENKHVPDITFMKRLIKMLNGILDNNIGYVISKVMFTLFRSINFFHKVTYNKARMANYVY